jgi:hypothetical protein
MGHPVLWRGWSAGLSLLFPPFAARRMGRRTPRAFVVRTRAFVVIDTKCGDSSLRSPDLLFFVLFVTGGCLSCPTSR